MCTHWTTILYPKKIAKMWCKFLGQEKKRVLSKIHLLCKTLKSICLKPHGGWGSHPLGLYRWCTTSVSYLVPMGGVIFLKLNHFRDPLVAC